MRMRRLRAVGVKIDAAHARLRGEWHKCRLQLVHFARAQSEFLLGQHDDAAAFRRFIGERAQLRGIGKIVPLRRRARDETPTAMRLPSVIVPVLSSSRTSTSPAASTARPLIASTLR